MRLESTGYGDAKRIVNDDGSLSAMAMKYTSGFWAIHDKDTDQKLTPAKFKTPTSAMKHWKEQHRNDDAE